MENFTELIQFLNVNQPQKLKCAALSSILGVTGTAEGISLFLKSDDLLETVLKLTNDNSSEIVKLALQFLINITANEEGSIKVFDMSLQIPNFDDGGLGIVSKSFKFVFDKNSKLADLWLMILNNITVVNNLAEKIMEKIKNGKDINDLVIIFSKTDYNKNAKLDLIATVFRNITSTYDGREIFCKDNCKLLEYIIPFISYEYSVTRKLGVTGVLRNICVDSTFHNQLLNDRDDILSSLLYPLAGPEQFTDEENEKLPIDLQYLQENKKREENPTLRLMLLESLLLLCATKQTREILRLKGAYEILREYHKWESEKNKNEKCLEACENVIQLLIRTEEEIGADNLKDLVIPNDLCKKFEELSPTPN